MDKIDKRLKYLFERYSAQNASSDELKELLDLLHEDNNHALKALLNAELDKVVSGKKVFEISSQESKEMWNAIQNQLPSTAKPNIIPITGSFNVSLLLKIAASVVITVGGYLLVHNNYTQPIKPTVIVAQTKPLPDVNPGGNKAILKTSNGSTIILDNAPNGILARQNNVEVRKMKNGQLQYVAVNSAESREVIFNTIITPRAGQYQATLPDGTKVWLNAASSIKFPSVFSGKHRNVEITGEVYFEVANNADKPFIVKTPKAEVQVLGTHFNIQAYDDEISEKTTLLEGAVSIRSNLTNNILKPGDQSVINTPGHISVINNIDINEEVAWKNGLFQFEGESVGYVMRQLARWYDMKVIYEGKIPEKQFTGFISKKTKLSGVIKMLKFADINLRIEGKNIIVVN